VRGGAVDDFPLAIPGREWGRHARRPSSAATVRNASKYFSLATLARRWQVGRERAAHAPCPIAGRMRAACGA